jgi:ABC-type sugar transport system substrate-binding protein
LALEGCSAASKVFSGAAESLGWNPTVLDTESKPSKIEASFHQAVNLGAEGIIMEAISPWSLVEPLVNEAKEAGAPSVCFSCDAAGEQTGTATEPTTALSAEVSNADEKQGELSAAQLILAAEGNADILFLSDPEYEATHLSEVGFHKLFDACEGCKISKELKFTGAELTTTVGAQIKAALTADPEIEYVWSPAGAFLPPAVIPAIEQLGSSTDVQVFCVAGQKAELEGVAEGGIIGGTTFTPEGWAIYAAVDQMNRILAGKPTVKEDVVPTYAVNSENVHLFLNSRESPVHYEEGFHKLWGVE